MLLLNIFFELYNSNSEITSVLALDIYLEDGQVQYKRRI